MADVDVVVLGGGPAGLAAAWRAAGAGRSVLVLERAPAVGGMAASFEVAGVRVDTRQPPAAPGHPAGRCWARCASCSATTCRPGRATAGCGLRPLGRLPAPPGRAGPHAAAARPCCRIGRDAAAAAGQPGPTRTRTPRCWSARSARSCYSALYGPYAEKLWGLPGRDIDAEQARRRVSAGGVWGIARKLVRARTGCGAGTGVLLPAPGLRPDRRRAGRGGGRGRGADRDRRRGDRGRAGDRRGSQVSTADGRTVRAGHVLPTVPLPVLARLARPRRRLPPTPGCAFRAMVLVYLVHEGGRWTAYDAHYLPGPQTPVTRLSEPANYRISRGRPGRPDRALRGDPLRGRRSRCGRPHRTSWPRW